MNKLPNLQKINEYLIYFLIFFLPTQLGKHFFFNFSYLSGVRIDYLAPTLHLTDVIVFFLLILNLRYIVTKLHNRLTYIFTGLLLINTIFSLSPWITIYKIIKFLEVIIIYLVIHKYNFDYKKILLAFLTGGILELFLSVSQLIHKKSLQGIFYFFGERYVNLSMPGIAKTTFRGVELLRPYGTFSHPNSLAGFYLLLYFFTLTYLPFEKYRILKQVVFITSSLLIFFSFSKITIVTYLVLNIFLIFSKRKQLDCMLCLVSRIAVVLVLSAIFISAQGDPLSATKRLILMQNSFSIFMHNPITGTGLGAYLVAQDKIPIPYSYFFLQPVHNILLLYLTETGIIIAFLTLYFLFKYVKKRLRDPSFLFIIISVVITGFFDHYWLTLQQNLLLLPVIFALLDRKISAKV